MTRQVGLPLANAVLAFSEGRYAAALKTLLDVRTIANRFGGSHAQRVKPTSPFNLQFAARAPADGGGRVASRPVRHNTAASGRAPSGQPRAGAEDIAR